MLGLGEFWHYCLSFFFLSSFVSFACFQYREICSLSTWQCEEALLLFTRKRPLCTCVRKAPLLTNIVLLYLRIFLKYFEDHVVTSSRRNVIWGLVERDTCIGPSSVGGGEARYSLYIPESEIAVGGWCVKGLGMALCSWVEARFIFHINCSHLHVVTPYC